MPITRHRGKQSRLQVIVAIALLAVAGIFALAHTFRLDKPNVDSLAAKVHRGMSEVDVLDVLKSPSGKIDSGGSSNRWIYEASNGELRIDFIGGSLETVRAFHYVSDAAWSRAKPGMSRDAVLAVLGNPDYGNNFANIGMDSVNASSEELYFGDGEVRLKNGLVEEVCQKGCGRDDKRWLYRNGGY